MTQPNIPGLEPTDLEERNAARFIRASQLGSFIGYLARTFKDGPVHDRQGQHITSVRWDDEVGRIVVK